MKNLVAAGATITASADQAARLRTVNAELDSLLTVSDSEKSSIDEKEVAIDFEVKPSKSDSRKKSVKAVSDDPEAETKEEEHEDNTTELDPVNARLLGKFVNLVDLLPPLPKKGNFDVETIKGSQYFFS